MRGLQPFAIRAAALERRLDPVRRGHRLGHGALDPALQGELHLDISLAHPLGDDARVESDFQ